MFLQGHLAELTAQVAAHEDLCSREKQGQSVKEKGDAHGPDPTPQASMPLLASTSIRTWCCPVGTHSRPSSGQQPPQRCTVTQLGTSCLATVPMTSTVKGTTTSRGWQVARAYTSIQDTTMGRPVKVKSPRGSLGHSHTTLPLPPSCLSLALLIHLGLSCLLCEMGRISLHPLVEW